MWYVRDVLYAVLNVRVSCFVVRGCGVSRRYIDVCYCDMFSVVNVYLDHLTTPSSVSLFPISLALNCSPLNVLSSLICSVGRAADILGGGDCWDDGADQVSQVQSLFLRYWAAFKIPEHVVRTHPEQLVHL